MKPIVIIGGSITVLFVVALLLKGHDSSPVTATVAPTARPAATGRTVAQRATPTAASTEPVLKLAKGGGCEASSTSFIRYNGEVTNISDHPLRRVRAVVTYADAQGTFIKTDSGALDFDPLLPGQSSPFTTITQTNPAISTCKVEFQEGISGPKLIATRDE